MAHAAQPGRGEDHRMKHLMLGSPAAGAAGMASRWRRAWSTMRRGAFIEQPDASSCLRLDPVSGQEPSGGAARSRPAEDSPAPVPDFESFKRFLEELHAAFPQNEYRWTRGKTRSCQWLLDRVP